MVPSRPTGSRVADRRAKLTDRSLPRRRPPRLRKALVRRSRFRQHAGMTKANDRITLREITPANRSEVESLAVTPEQETFVAGVTESLIEAAETPGACPWYRAIYAGEEPVGFVMISWNCVPRPPEIIGPWFLWKLLIDHRYQGRGYGSEAVRVVAELVSQAGARELLTSCFLDRDGSPGPFYARLGFVSTGDLDVDGETILRLPLHSNDATVDPRTEDLAQ
jgi:RimJ/RimL family protein N-acetyltransferase